MIAATMNDIAANLMQVRQRVQAAAKAATRDPNDITLVAVSKKHSAEAIKNAFAAGQRDFGENYVQEALEKITALADLPLNWHFIGPIQSNKTRAIAENFNWVHSVDRLKIAQRLSEQRDPGLAPLNICLQINIDRESSKSGFAPDQVHDAALEMTNLPNLHIRGLMCIPNRIELSPSKTADNAFQRLAKIQDSLQQHKQLAHLDCLSMGMSDDLEAAIAAGATLIRVGTAIFGPRN